jgi:hypothetical protein
MLMLIEMSTVALGAAPGAAANLTIPIYPCVSWRDALVK